MATKNRPVELSNHHIGELRTRFDEYRLDTVLDIDGTFTARDIDRSRYQTKGVLRILRNCGAVEVVDEVRVEDVNGNGRSVINEYRLRPSVVEYLRDYQSERPELPCGCRAHVFHNDNGTFGCRNCDDDPEFSRETVEEAMSE